MTATPKLEEVFKLSGVPTYTFVEPREYSRLLVALRTPGRGVVIEGPSGIGKTTAVTRALQGLPGGDHALRLSARRKDDRELIRELPDIRDAGFVVIDDFHRLENDVRSDIADHLKLLADEETAHTKLVILGINRAGDSLISFARDLIGRLDVIPFEANPDDRIRKLVREGADVLNVALPERAIATLAKGSFHLTQMLCHAACLASDITETQPARHQLTTPMEVVLERVMDDLSLNFMEIAMKFATGPQFSRGGRAPYLHMLQWLGAGKEWAISLDREISHHPELRSSFKKVVERGHLAEFLAHHDDLGDLLHFDPQTHVLAVEDPKFFFFIKNLAWGKFAERVGYLNSGFPHRYDVTLSFAGTDRHIAEMLRDTLLDREFAVFYDEDEQHDILAANVEQYLAPIYQSEATFVVCLLGAEYPKRVWTQFESKQFRSRFGAESVVPVWFSSAPPGLFDETSTIGGFFLRDDDPLGPQIEKLTELLEQKITGFRLQPRVEPGEFYCRQCHLVHPQSLLAEGRMTLCQDCAEKFRIV